MHQVWRAGRSIELTSLAHRKHYRAQEGLESWLRLRFDAIPVSKERYNRMSAPAQKDGPAPSSLARHAVLLASGASLSRLREAAGLA